MFGKRKKNITLKQDDKKEGSKRVDLSVEKLALSNTISLEALIEVLSQKGLIKKEEVLEEVKKIGKNSKMIYPEKK